MPLPQDRREALARLVREHGYERRQEPFQLSSGAWSRDYVDGKYTVATGPALREVSQAVVDLLGDDFEAVGGPTMGADALAHGVAMVSGRAWFSVRKEAKGHGRETWVEGTRLSAGDRVVMVEDVVSTGGSLLRAVEKIADLGAEVVAATALLDRGRDVAERFAGAGIRWDPLLTWVDLGIEPL